LKSTILAAVLIAAALSTGCGKKPPNITPDASLSFDNGQVLGALDTGRDVTTVWNTYGIAPFTTPVTRRVVQFHTSAVTVLDARGSGWQQAIKTSLAEVQKNLPADAGTRLAPYFGLVTALLDRLASRAFDEATSAEVIAVYQAKLKASLQTDRNWLAAHP